MSDTLLTDKGIIKFYDGTIIAIENQQYSADGINNWEETFNPNDHISTLDGVTPLKGHKFKRVKHSGDTNYQNPYRIIPDGVEMRTLENQLQYKLIDEDDTEWKNLYDLESLKGEDGEKGDKGIPGEGFHIDIYGYYQSRPDCCNTLSSSNCSSCNTQGSTSNSSTTFLSLGDGVLVLTQALITAGTVTVDTVAYTHFSNDLITWSPLAGGILDFEARYLATNGTGAVYTDMRTEDYYQTRGIAYVCVDGSWIVLTNIATPSYMVGERIGSTNIGYLNNFADELITDFVPNTIGLNQDGIFEIGEQSITEHAFDQDIVSDGLEIPTAMDKIQIKPDDFAGFGLNYYTSDADSLVDLQVLVDDLLSDGLNIEVGTASDGETPNLIKVNVNDLLNNDSGLISSTEADTFDDLEVNLGEGLKLDGGTPQAITLDVDDLSLMVDSDSVRIKPYTSSNDGVMLNHLNPNIIWENRGVGLDSANGIYARIDGVTIGYNGSGNLEIPFNSVTGDRLNDNVADNTKGLQVLNDLLSVKVDDTSIGFNGSGELEYKGLSGQVVSTIIPTLNGSVLDTVRDDVTFGLTDGTGIIANMTSDAATDIMSLQLDVDEAWLSAQIQAEIGSGIVTYWEGLAKSNTEATTIEEFITDLGHVELNTWYGNGAVSDGQGASPFNVAGLLLKAPSGEVYRQIVDAEGNLGTVLIP